MKESHQQRGHEYTADRAALLQRDADCIQAQQLWRSPRLRQTLLATYSLLDLTTALNEVRVSLHCQKTGTRGFATNLISFL